MPPVGARPVFVVSPPRSGEGLLLASLSLASGIWHPRTDASFLDGMEELEAGEDRRDSHRLTAEDATPELAGAARERLIELSVDREGRPAAGAEAEEVRAVAGGPRLALRVPFLAEVFPDAVFACVVRDPEEAVAEMLTAWRSGRLVSVDPLPGWDGPPWSLPLIPGWRSLSGEPLEDVVVEQWRAIAETVLDDLEALPAERWAVVDHGALLARPRTELRRLCGFLDVPYDQALLSPVENVARRRRRDSVVASAELAEVLPRAAGAYARARDLVAEPPPEKPRRSGAPDSPFRSVSTASFAPALSRLGASLLVSTYQTGKLVVARVRDGLLNTHFRDFDKPMGMALARGRLALGTRVEVWDFRDMPDVARRIEPAGLHDHCFVPRNRHVTGDIAIHEMGFAAGELWVVNTAFSCLATLDPHHSFVPRWRPPWITALQPGDRCHLNGMAVVDDRVKYVTALGTGDAPGSWREGKASGGVILDVPSGEVVSSGLSMPHSPTWHNERLWVLESGKGELCVVDAETGRRDPVVELPGFARGMTMSGRTAFIGLSQIRESSTFGDLPITRRLQERMCGVWMVDLGRGEVTGFLRFDDLVQEVFDVELLPGMRYPDIAESASQATAASFVLP